MTASCSAVVKVSACKQKQVVVNPVGVQGIQGAKGESVSLLALAFQQAAIAAFTTGYQELTYTDRSVTNITTWTDSSKTTLLLTETRTYANGLLIQISYNRGSSTLTETRTYVNGLLISVSSAIADTAAANLAGSLLSRSRFSGSLSVEKRLAGSIQASSYLSGLLAVNGLTLTGSLLSHSGFSGVLSTEKRLNGSLLSRSSITGALTVEKRLATTIQSSSALTGALAGSASTPSLDFSDGNNSQYLPVIF